MKEKTRLPEIKFRLLLYFVTLIFCILLVAETVFGYFPFAVEIVIFVAAMYTFYKAIISVVNVIRVRKMKSLLLVTI